jgi:hypothetical protein
MNNAHIVIWNEAHPDDLMPQKGFVIHHKDGDHSNNILSNLEKVTKKWHDAFHKKGDRNPAKRPEVRALISKHHPHLSGKDHPIFGIHRTEETKRKMSEAKKGKPWTKARRQASVKGEAI